MNTHDFPHSVLYGAANAHSPEPSRRKAHERSRPQPSGQPGRYAIGGRSDSSTRAVGRRASTLGTTRCSATMTLGGSERSELISGVHWN